MTNTLPNVSPTGRYNITEASALLGVHRNTISRWLKEGKIKSGIRKKTFRLYITGTEILKFWNA